MKIKIGVFALLFYVMSLSFILAQSNTAGTGNNNQTDALFSNYNIDFRNTYFRSQKKAKSAELVSVYLFDDWKNKLTIKTINGKILKLNSANYNIKTDRFEVTTMKDSIYILQPSAIKEVKINNQEFTMDLKGEDKYYEIVYTGKNRTLLKRYGYKIKEGAINPMTLEKLGKDVVLLTSSYYIMERDDITPVQLKKKSIIEVFENYKPTVLKFAKNNNLSFKTENDIVRIIQYIESI